MKKTRPLHEVRLWRNDQLFNIDFASYTLSDHHFSKHFHDHFVIELVLNGADDFYCAGKTYTAVTNQLVLINPGEVHTGNTVANNTLRYFSLSPGRETLDSIARQSGINLPVGFNFQETLIDNPALTVKFVALHNSFQNGESILQKQELLIDSMSALLNQCTGNNYLTTPVAQDDRRVSLLIDFIRHHYSEEISLQKLASLVNLNPFHVLRVFKKSTGLTPYEYVLVTRIEQARIFLRKGFKVEQAALATGFYDSSHFNRLFYKIAGTSPISYRWSKGQYRTSFTG